jgi:hypothetical protein
VAIYDAGGATPTQARVPLGEQLIAASIAYEQRAGTKKEEVSQKNSSGSSKQTPASQPTPAPQSSAGQPNLPASFNPIVRLEWTTPEKLHFQTAFVRLMPSETINTFQRWHLLNLSAQAVILK